MNVMQALGTVAVPTLICLIVGFVLLAIELFIPGFGIMGISGILLLAVAVVLQFLYGSAVMGGTLAAIVLVVILLGLLLFIRSLQKGRLARSFIVLNDSIDATGSENDLEKYVGVTGVSITALRPSGIAQIRGSRMNVMTGGDFIDPGAAIVVTGADGMTLTVEKYTEEQA